MMYPTVAGLTLLLCLGVSDAIEASPALPLVPMFPAFPIYPAAPPPFGFFPSLFGGLEKVIEGTANRFAVATGGTWEQNDTEKKITITGNLPTGFEADKAEIQTNDKEITVKIQKTFAKREEKENKTAAVAAEDEIIERTFELPFAVRNSDVHKVASDNTLKLEIDVPEGVAIQPAVHTPHSSMSSFQFHSGNSNAQGMMMSSHNMFGGNAAAPFHSFLAPLLGPAPLFANALFHMPSGPQSLSSGYAHDVDQAHALRKTSAQQALEQQQQQPNAVAAQAPADASSNGEEDSPFLPLHPRRDSIGGFGGGLSGFGGLGGFGGLMWPLMAHPAQLMAGLDMPAQPSVLGEWTETVTPDQVVIVGTLPKNGDPSKVFTSISGRKLTVKEMSRSVSKKHTKNDPKGQGIVEDEQAQLEKQILTLPFETDMSKVEKSVDLEAKKITLKIPVPAGVTVEPVTNAPMRSSSESFSSHSFSSSGASGRTFSRSFYGTSMF